MQAGQEKLRQNKSEKLQVWCLLNTVQSLWPVISHGKTLLQGYMAKVLIIWFQIFQICVS